MNISVSLDDEAWNKIRESDNKSELICKLIKDYAPNKVTLLVQEINDRIEKIKDLGYEVEFDFKKVVKWLNLWI